MNHTKPDCTATNIFISDNGLQCGNCLAYEEKEKPDTWTITAQFTVFAGDMTKENVIQNAQTIISEMTDGSDLIGATVIDAVPNEI